MRWKARPGPTDDTGRPGRALNKLAQKHAEKAELVKLRYFTGFTVAEAAQALGISTTTADRYWTYAAPGSFASLPRTKKPNLVRVSRRILKARWGFSPDDGAFTLGRKSQTAS